MDASKQYISKNLPTRIVGSTREEEENKPERINAKPTIGADIEQNCSLGEKSMSFWTVVLGCIPFNFSYGPNPEKSHMAAISRW